MAETVRLQAQSRTEFGKGAARRVRRAGNIPAVIYGHGSDPIHVTLPGHETMMAVKVSNAILTVSVDGQDHLTLVKEVQRDVLRPLIHHIDLISVRKGEKVTVDITVIVVGDAAPDTFVDLDTSELTVEAEATSIPERVEVSVEGLAPGTQILARDVVLPAGVSLGVDPETLIVNVTQSAESDGGDEDGADAEAAPESE